MEEVRKLTLYSRDNRFDNSVEIITILSFIRLAEIPLKEGLDIQVLAQKEEGKRFMMDEWVCILERQSKLRKYGTLVSGLANVMRFIYATEVIDYDFYPQNPLERAKLD